MVFSEFTTSIKDFTSYTSMRIFKVRKVKMMQKTNRSERRILEWLAEVTGWLQIVASFTLVSAVIGAIIYSTDFSNGRLIIGILLTVAGLIAGIFLATRQLKGNGTIQFLSRTSSIPDLDESFDDAEQK